MNRHWITPLLAGLLVIGLGAGCSDDAKQPTDPGSQTENPNLDDPLGGLSFQDERPAFGDPDLEASSGIELPVDDTMNSDPDVTRWMNAESVKVYAVTLLWGVLDRDISIRGDGGPSNVPATDWSGSAEITDGAVIVRSTISFETGDHLNPRIDRRVVEWVSQTTVGFDGVRLVLYYPETDTPEDDTFTVKAGAHEWTLAVSELADYSNIFTIDDVNRFSIRAFELIPQVCARGFVGGAWIGPSLGDEMGTFRGRWVSSDGSVSGYLRGHFGINSESQKVFFGKYIDLDGNVLGIIRGTYGDDGLEAMGPGMDGYMCSLGWFRGEWVNESGTVEGHVGGYWRSVVGGTEGFFEGRWTENCMGS